MYQRSQPKKWYVYVGDRLVEVVHAITERDEIAKASDLTWQRASTLCAQTTIRERRA